MLSLVTALTLAVVTAEAKTTKTEKPHAGTVKSHKKVGKHARHGLRKTASWKRHGRPEDRAGARAEIQAALIRENYMEDAPSGTWDETSCRAMVKSQESTPAGRQGCARFPRAYELGLGPNHEDLINPESAMTMRPHTGLAEKGMVSGPAPLSQ